MLSNLSANWLMALGAALCLITVYVLYKVTIFLKDFFQPFKKGKSYLCRVSDISDGDTLTCYRMNLRRSKTKLRFAYVDAPESTQAYGKESARLIKSMVYKKFVRVKITDVDRYGRCVGVIYRYRKCMNEEMVKRGAAWVYEEYIRDQKHLHYMMNLQSKARKQKKGLWKASRPMRPKEYRKLHK
ncbi:MULTISPECIES: thermonuclease family protein [unclassified Acinetobacter]|uniref:thermonuclease family protein n=1 Tax=unclassified Acinetobacter TaxID=196816 RepID=UPI0015D1BBE8|nr:MULTISPECIES: thermonuclease family protein [unclassified Acinetobacter]